MLCGLIRYLQNSEAPMVYKDLFAQIVSQIRLDWRQAGGEDREI